MLLETWMFIYISGSGVMHTEKVHTKEQCEKIEQWTKAHDINDGEARMSCEQLNPSIKERAKEFSKKITKKIEEKAKEEIHD